MQTRPYPQDLVSFCYALVGRLSSLMPGHLTLTFGSAQPVAPVSWRDWRPEELEQLYTEVCLAALRQGGVGDSLQLRLVGRGSESRLVLQAECLPTLAPEIVEKVRQRGGGLSGSRLLIPIPVAQGEG